MAGYTFTAYGHLGYPLEQHTAEYSGDTSIEEVLNRLTVPTSTQNGMVFTHWGLSIDGGWLDGKTVEQVAIEDGTSDIQLYGVYDYNNNSIQVVLQSNGGHWSSESDTQKVLKMERGTSLGEISSALGGNPVRTGYTFMGWMNGDKVAKWDEPFLGNVSLTAIWENDTSDITIHSQWGNITVPGGTKVSDVDWNLINVNIPDQRTYLDTLVPSKNGIPGTKIRGFDFSGSNMPFKIKYFDDNSFNSDLLNGNTIGSYDKTTIPFDKHESAYILSGSVMVGAVSTGVEVKFASFNMGLETGPGLYVNSIKIWDALVDKWISASDSTFKFDADTKLLTFTNLLVTTSITNNGLVYDNDIRVIIPQRIGDLHLEDEMTLYEDITINPDIVADIMWSTVRFVNSQTGIFTEVTKQDGTKLSDFYKDVNPNEYYMNDNDLIGFFSEQTNGNKVSMSNKIYMNHTIYSRYVSSIPKMVETHISLYANGGTFYTGTTRETDSIVIGFNSGITFGQAQVYFPPVKNSKMKPIYWYMGNHEPVSNIVINSDVLIKPLWSIEGSEELYRLPREYYLIDRDTMDWGWNEMEKFSLSNRDSIFVVEPEGLGTEFQYSNESITVQGWSSSERNIAQNDISFNAYYHDYDNYRKLGRWIRGRRLAIAVLNDTAIPTYYNVELKNIERSEIAYSYDNIMTGKLSFTKQSPAYDLEFIGLGTDGILDNADDQNRRNAYIKLYTTSIMRNLSTFTILANDINTGKHINDSVSGSIAEGSFMRYSTVPFTEEWINSTMWNGDGKSLYTSIDLTTSDPIILGIGKWVISTNSDGYLKINELAPHIFNDYTGQTINMIGGSSGNFTGIAYKEKEI